MKKVFVVLLLLVSAFLIGSAEFAFAGPSCTNYQDYNCTWTETQYGEIYGTGSDCIELCYANGFEVDINDSAGIDEFYGYLYPAIDNRHLLGTVYDLLIHTWAGCSVEFKGKSMIAKLTYIEADYGSVVTFKCTPCKDCCH